MKNWIVVDVESDGPIPGLYSMVSFGAVLVTDMNKTFYGQTSPISKLWLPNALAVSGHTRAEHESFANPEKTMQQFADWIKSIVTEGERPIFVSDNLAFDWQWINWYFHSYLSHNPFGYSGRRIGDIWSGMMMKCNKSTDWKRFRQRKHTHHPVDDAIGNAEALLEFKKRGLQ